MNYGNSISAIHMDPLKTSDHQQMNTPIINNHKRDEAFIPPVPESYCFVGENFLSETFSVDGFVRRNSKRVHSLEKLKEHLSAYLKILKQSMINLINEDYTEFINLSANLVSFDKSINNIKTPVLKFKSEANGAKFKIDEMIISINSKQERLKAIRESKQKLNMIMEIIEYLDRIEANSEHIELMIESSEVDIDQKFYIYSALNENSVLIARLNINFDCLLENIENQKNVSNPFLVKLKQRFVIVREKFYEILKNEILSLLKYNREILRNDVVLLNKFMTIIQQIFSMYLIDGNKKQLEMIIRNEIVMPSLEKIICDIQMSKDGLENMFSRIIQFIEDDCFLLIKVLSLEKRFSSFKFELIVSTIWDTFVDLFLVRTPLLLSDSETFRKNYFLTFKFIEEFLNKTSLVDHRTQFEQQPSYIQLKSKFKLNVYFHMKLKKISMNLESSFDRINYSVVKDSNQNQNFKLNITQIIYDNLIDCWRNLDQNFYIGDLFIYLWKLTLKILSRFATWFSRIDLNNISSYFRMINNNSLNETDLKKLVLQTLSFLIADSYSIVNEFTIIFNKIIQPHWDIFYTNRISPKIVNSDSQIIQHSSLKQSFDEAIHNFQISACNKTIFLMKTEIIEQCKRLLNSANDIPRLYRRTNKDKPKESSDYIHKCIEQLVECSKMSGFSVTSSHKLLTEILIDIAQHYKNLTLEVLTSVQKTEDSLKKLKKLKVNPSGLLSPSNTTMSDDDKIRLQIFYDVQTFGDQIQEQFQIDVKNIKPYYELLETIQSLKVLQ